MPEGSARFPGTSPPFDQGIFHTAFHTLRKNPLKTVKSHANRNRPQILYLSASDEKCKTMKNSENPILAFGNRSRRRCHPNTCDCGITMPFATDSHTARPSMPPPNTLMLPTNGGAASTKRPMPAVGDNISPGCQSARHLTSGSSTRGLAQGAK